MPDTQDNKLFEESKNSTDPHAFERLRREQEAPVSDIDCSTESVVSNAEEIPSREDLQESTETTDQHFSESHFQGNQQSPTNIERSVEPVILNTVELPSE